MEIIITTTFVIMFSGSCAPCDSVHLMLQEPRSCLSLSTSGWMHTYLLFNCCA